MNVSCPECSTVFRVDPDKVPQGGVMARCSRCPGIFRVSSVEPEPSAETPRAPASAPARVETPAAAPAADAPAEAPKAAPAAASVEARAFSPFGTVDPKARARRLARALVSDIVVYHPERRDRSRRDGTLRQEFREEIRKSWDEYVVQVGADFARETPFFRDALNEILAGGERVF
jgi:predicted Zn finger-like uncharacterized protein